MEIEIAKVLRNLYDMRVQKQIVLQRSELSHIKLVEFAFNL